MNTAVLRTCWSIDLRLGADLTLLASGSGGSGLGLGASTLPNDTTDFDTTAFMLNKECAGMVGCVAELDGTAYEIRETHIIISIHIIPV